MLMVIIEANFVAGSNAGGRRQQAMKVSSVPARA